MTCHLSRLQPELTLAIIDIISEQPWRKIALRRWSGTSTFYRSLLAPYVFQKLPLKNTEGSGASLEFIANSPYASYAREIYFKGTAPSDGEEGFEDTESVFPDAVRIILSNLDRFPKLETVQIEFDFESDDKWTDGYFYVFVDSEYGEEVVEAEESEGWRALMAKTYRALAQNKTPSFKELKFENVLPKEVSTFSSPEFHDFLGSMERFEISTWGADNGVGWCSNTLEGFREFIPHLDQYFFNNLASVKSLTIFAHEDGPIGGSMQQDLPISDSKMPLLQSLRLENIVIGENLKNFLLVHLETLQELILINCHSTIGYADDGLYWEQLFEAILQARPKVLRKLSVEPKVWFYSLDYSDDEETKPEVQSAYKELEEDPKRRLFAYAYISDKYGSLYGDRDKTLESFEKGADQRTYDSLMQLVDRNKTRKA